MGMVYPLPLLSFVPHFGYQFWERFPGEVENVVCMETNIFVLRKYHSSFIQTVHAQVELPPTQTT